MPHVHRHCIKYTANTPKATDFLDVHRFLSHFSCILMNLSQSSNMGKVCAKTTRRGLCPSPPGGSDSSIKHTRVGQEGEKQPGPHQPRKRVHHGVHLRLGLAGGVVGVVERGQAGPDTHVDGSTQVARQTHLGCTGSPERLVSDPRPCPRAE